MATQEEQTAQMMQWANDAVNVAIAWMLAPAGSPEEAVMGAGVDRALGAIPDHAVALNVIRVLLYDIARSRIEAEQS